MLDEHAVKGQKNLAQFKIHKKVIREDVMYLAFPKSMQMTQFIQKFNHELVEIQRKGKIKGMANHSTAQSH
jgi:hypothetical protein